MNPSVLIVDDHVLFGEVLAPILEEADLDVVGVAVDAGSGVRLAEEVRPDLALVDLALGEVNGFVAADRIRHSSPGTRCVIVSAMGDSVSVAEALSRGLHGYLTKDLPASEIVAGIRAVLDGQVVLPPTVVRTKSAVTFPRSDDVRLLVDQLTPREWEVLALLVEGASGSEIGSRLEISPSTVRTHVQGILTKLQVHSRLEAATFAVRHGLFDTDPGSGLSRSA